MKFIQGADRNQKILFPESLDQIVTEDNEVRIIDLFVESIKLSDFKFLIKSSSEGRPAYHPKDMLKLYVYGYLNSIRSSRVLEKECNRNIELIWLLRGLVPDHNTISNFRRDNEKAIRKVFRLTVSIAKEFNLIGGKLIAGDSTKLRAQNSKKNNFNEKKIERHLAYIDAKLDEYNKALEIADNNNKQIIEEVIKKQTERKLDYQKISQELKESGETQLSTSDPESRQMITRNNITEVAYNIQTVVDEKKNIPIDYKVTNENDSKAMGGMLRRAKVILQSTGFTALYDKGYHNGSELKTAIDMGVNIMVAIPEIPVTVPDENYSVVNFKYDEKNDTYICPENNILTSNGNLYKKSRGKKYLLHVTHYKTIACSTCPVKEKCTSNKSGRVIERSEYAKYVEQNKKSIEADPTVYKKRQAIVEHPYGILKRQWGFSYIMTKKGKKRASADVGFMFVAYNLRRIINIIGFEELVKFLKARVLAFALKSAHIKMIRLNIVNPIFPKHFSKQLYKVAYIVSNCL